MIQCNNSFGRLKEIILGDVDFNVIQYCEPAEQERLTHIFNKTKQDLNQLHKQLEQKGVIVHRPKMIHKQEVKIPLCPRDILFVTGNTIIVTHTYQKETLHSSLYFKDVIDSLHAQGWECLFMPTPKSNGPIFEAASAYKFEKDIFVSNGDTWNTQGLQWMQNALPDYNFHVCDNPKITGHIDTHFAILRPGLVWSGHPKNDLPEYFKTWEVIEVDTSTDKTLRTGQTLVDHKVQDDDFEGTTLSVNVLSLDENTVFLYDHYKDNANILQLLDKHKIEPIWVEFTFSHFFNQGLTCLTTEINRD
tara:strand:- start:502 stop:1413 length:912 start_codon:yes stop_codon:yes gene_type:complete